jgi:predicted ribosome quality control (RQC) complex YloA/Tae2 family protein
MYFFTASSGHTLYAGRDKHENEDLIRYGLPEDVWFHVDNLSSAHIYLRMNKGEKLKEIDPAIIMECCQLVKVNSDLQRLLLYALLLYAVAMLEALQLALTVHVALFLFV